MSMYINTNVSSLNAQRNLMNSGKSLDTSYTRLASGLRINSAKDDAAGLQISNRMTAQINGLDQGNRNANDGISMAQTAEGAMEEVSGMLQRIRTLAQQSANGTNSADDRAALGKEVGQLKTEIDRISKDTTFAGTKLFDGAATNTFSFQVGPDGDSQTISFDLSKIEVTSLKAAATLAVDTVANSRRPLPYPRCGLRHRNRQYDQAEYPAAGRLQHPGPGQPASAVGPVAAGSLRPFRLTTE